MDDITVPGRPSAPAPQPIVQQAPQSMSLLPGLNVPSPPQQGPPPTQEGSPAQLNYNNSGDVAAIRSANAANAPQGGMANPGIYGLLPHNLQHGTLRNVLGALGDAFLTGANKQPEYEPRMQRQEIGDAMAGYNPEDPDSVRAAASRVAATGATGAAEMADKLQQQAEQAALRRATMEQTGVYRQSLIQNRADSQLRSLMPQVGGMMNSATTAADYATRYAQAEAIAQRIGPDYHASDFGLLSPDQWTPGMSPQGMTSNQQQVSTDKGAQRDVSVANNVRTNRSREASARIGATGHVAAAQVSADRPSPTTADAALQARIENGTATDQDREMWAHKTQVSRNSRRPSPSANAAPQQQFIPGHTYKDRNNKTATYNANGTWTPH